MKKFFSPPDDSNAPYQQYDKIRVTFHTKKGLMVEHVDANGTADLIYNNLNLSGGGKRSASEERARKKADKRRRCRWQEETHCCQEET